MAHASILAILPLAALALLALAAASVAVSLSAQLAVRRVLRRTHAPPTPAHLPPISVLCNRHVRWSQMRRHIVPWTYLAEEAA